MAGIFGTKAPLLADINLILLVGILVLLILGYMMMKRRRLRTHGYIMLTVVVLKLISILLIMLPSARIILFEPSFAALVPIVAIHISIGAITQAIGMYLVFVVWRLKEPIASCFKSKRRMKPLLITWIFMIFLGIGLYYLLYI